MVHGLQNTPSLAVCQSGYGSFASNRSGEWCVYRKTPHNRARRQGGSLELSKRFYMHHLTVHLVPYCEIGPLASIDTVENHHHQNKSSCSYASFFMEDQNVCVSCFTLLNSACLAMRKYICGQPKIRCNAP